MNKILDTVQVDIDKAKAAGDVEDSTFADATLAKQYGIKVAIHNHGPEDKIFPSPYDAYKAIKGRDKMMGLCVDVGHTWRAGVDPARAVVELREDDFLSGYVVPGLAASASFGTVWIGAPTNRDAGESGASWSSVASGCA